MTKPVADVLRNYQYEHDLTQHEMAKFLGIAQPTYNNWINGKAKINPAKYYQRIATLCEIEMELILPRSVVGGKIKQNQSLESLSIALGFCQKFAEKLEEINELLGKENKQLKIIIVEKETAIESLKKKVR